MTNKKKNKKGKGSQIPESKIQCPECKKIIDEGLTFCPECGSRIPTFLQFHLKEDS